jgi:hypothetical protein
MAFNLTRALDFNKFTMALAAAGFGYVSATASDTPEPKIMAKFIATAAILSFVCSVILGTFVMGRASKVSNECQRDTTMSVLGQFHLALLLIGLVLAGTLMLDKIWKWSTPNQSSAIAAPSKP